MNNVTLDVKELRVKWAIDDVNNALENLIPLIDRVQDVELMEVLADYLQAIATYVRVSNEQL